MKPILSTQLGNSYYHNTGAYQKEFDELCKKHIKPDGRSDTLNGELIRAISSLLYEYYNNGNCNACDIQSKWNGSYEEETITVDEFYSNFLDIISESIVQILPEVYDAIRAVKTFIKDDYYGSKIQFADEHMQLYENLCDIVVYYVLNNEDREIPSYYNN
jgi:hypothetical protein